MKVLTGIYQNVSDSIRNYKPEIWFPLAIILLNGFAHIFNTQYLFSQMDHPDTHRNVQLAISIFGGFSIIVGSLISWLLISVVLFFWCELFYDAEGSFRNFFEIVGICHFLLLIATLACSIFILTGLPDEFIAIEANATDSQSIVEAINVSLSPLRFIGAAGRICFALVLVPMVRAFFQLRWLQAFCSVCIPYAIYWLMSKMLQSFFQFY